MRYPALKATALWCIANGVQIPEDILSVLADVKALQDYDNTLTRLVSIRVQQLRQTLVPPGSFGEDLSAAIEAGLNEAWRLGMRENDVTDMLPEWQDIVDGIIAEERTHIPDFSQYLADTAPDAESMGEAMSMVQNRLSLWIGRYTDVYNQAVLASAEEKTKLEWNYGDTKHCDTCAQLNGIVAYAREWEEAGVHPQQPPNDRLTCAGWECQCQLLPTDKRRSPNALDKILAVVLGV